jgi:hypothetical protein
MPLIPHDGTPLDAERTRDIVTRFRRDGFVHVPGILQADEITGLRDLTDRLIEQWGDREDPERHDPHYVQRHRHSDGRETPFILRNTIELDPVFPTMLVREPILSLAQAIVGEGARFCGQNVLRNPPGVAIENWHVDGAVHFPLPDDVPRHAAPPATLWLTVQIALTDVDDVRHGPTQYVPGSHLSGRHPNSTSWPTFEGRGPVSVLCKAGDIYIQDPQCWHRGGPNTSERTRYLMQSQYAVDWAFRRFGWMNRVPVDEQVLRDADDNLLRVLGRRRPDGSGPR